MRRIANDLKRWLYLVAWRYGILWLGVTAKLNRACVWFHAQFRALTEPRQGSQCPACGGVSGSNHHAEIAALSPDEADALLAWCEESPKPRSTRELRGEVHRPRVKIGERTSSDACKIDDHLGLTGFCPAGYLGHTG